MLSALCTPRPRPPTGCPTSAAPSASSPGPVLSPQPPQPLLLTVPHPHCLWPKAWVILALPTPLPPAHQPPIPSLASPHSKRSCSPTSPAARNELTVPVGGRQALPLRPGLISRPAPLFLSGAPRCSPSACAICSPCVACAVLTPQNSSGSNSSPGTSPRPQGPHSVSTRAASLGGAPGKGQLDPRQEASEQSSLSRRCRLVLGRPLVGTGSSALTAEPAPCPPARTCSPLARTHL